MKKKPQYYQQYDIPSSFSNPNLIKIIDFYLFRCPVPDTSYRGKELREYGFIGQAAFSRLKSAMLQAASPSLSKNYKPCKKSELESSFRSIETISPPDEYCVFLKHDEKTVMNSLFSAIRNAFAHGSFNVKSYQGVRIYFLLNFNDYKKAQIVLQEKTLLAWINLIEAGYGSLCSAKRRIHHV